MKTPFKFLESYTKNDKAIFFGRQKETEELYQKVFRSNLTLVYGPSGSGKTSLVNCGLANCFAETDWFQISVRRHENLAEGIVQNLWRALKENTQHHRRKSPQKLPDSDASITTLIHRLYLGHFKPIYLIFDQFEELFILGDQEEREAVGHILKEILESEENCSIILVMREEYLAELDHYENDISHIRNNRLRVETMGRTQIKQVIKSMLEAPGFNIQLYEPEHTLTQIIKNISHGNQIQLAYLQVYLDRLYQVAQTDEGESAIFSPNLVEQTGELEDIMGLFLNEQLNLIHQNLTPSYPAVTLEQLWQFLSVFVTVKGTKVPVSKESLTQQNIPFKPDFVREALQQLYNSRILRDEDGIYEIAHDSLASYIADNISHENRKLKEAENLLEERFSVWKLTGAWLSKKELDYLSFFENQLNLKSEVRSFFNKSRRIAQKKQRQLIGGIMVGITIIGLAIFAFYNAWQIRIINESLSLIAEAQNLVEKDPTFALEKIVEAIELNQNRLSEDILYETYRENNFYRDMLTLSTEIRTLAVAPDEEQLAFTTTGNNGGRVLYLVDRSGRKIDSLTTADNINDVTFAPNGKYLLLGADDGNAYLWSPEEKIQKTISHYDSRVQGNINVTAVAFSPNGDFLGTGVESGRVFIYRTSERLNDIKQPIYQIDTLHNSIQTLVFSQSRPEIFVGSALGEIACLNIETKRIKVGQISYEPILGFHQKDDSSLIVCTEGQLNIWHLENNKTTNYNAAKDLELSTLFAIAPDGKHILTIEDRNKIRLSDINGDAKHIFIGHKDEINQLIFSHNGKHFYTTGQDGYLKQWVVPYAATLLSESSSFPVNTLRLSDDQNHIFIGRAALEIIDSLGKSILSVKPPADRILDVSPAASSLLWEADGQLHLGDFSSQKPPIIFERASNIRKAIFSPNGNRILSTYYEGGTVLWDQNGNIIHEITDINPSIALAFSNDENYFILGGDDGIVSIWDTNSGVKQQEYKHDGVLKVIKISPKNDIVVSANESDYLKLYDISKRNTDQLEQSNLQILDIAISQDGEWIAVAKEKGILCIRDKSGHLYHELKINDHDINKVSFLSNPQSLIFGQENGKVFQIEIQKFLLDR